VLLGNSIRSYGITTLNRFSNSCISLERFPPINFTFLYFRESCIQAFTISWLLDSYPIWRCVLLTSRTRFKSSNLSLRNNMPTLIFNCFVDCESYNCTLTLLNWRPVGQSNVLTRVSYHNHVLFNPPKNYDGMLLFFHRYSCQHS